MKRLVFPLRILLGIAVAVAAAWYVVDRAFFGWTERPPAASADSRPRSLAPFTQLAIEGLVDVTLVQGPVESIRVDTPAKRRPGVRADVRDGTLVIDNADDGGGF